MFTESTKNLLSKTTPINLRPPPILSLLVTLILAVASAYAVMAQRGSANAPTPGSVIVRPRKIVITRSPAVTKHAPERKSAVIVLPMVSGLSDPEVLARVRAALDIKNAFQLTLQEYREDTWLSDFGYEVNYNADYLLDITFTQNGIGAYPDTHQRHLLLNLRNGTRVRAAEAFEPTKLDALIELVNSELKRELQKLKSEHMAGLQDEDERQTLTDAYGHLEFDRLTIDEFEVGKTGVTFLFDAGFPHVMKALEPQGRYFFSYKTLNDYIRRDGPLAKFRN
ncbi:MAG TPA: hypothetical protein VJV03_15910 [Pyrinomonadaceae bacterium]|nr:hypothetical protein [Pyrinomonadaceae bacterium]